MTKILVAYTKDNRVIGLGNTLPWPKLKGDLPRFKTMTTDQVVIMGRKTWESLPNQILPNRINYVVSRDPDKYDPGLTNLFFCKTVEKAIECAKNHHPSKEIFIIGGEQIYRHALENQLVEEIIASEVEAHYEGDAFFPELPKDWRFVEETPCEGYNLVHYRFATENWT